MVAGLPFRLRFRLPSVPTPLSAPLSAARPPAALAAGGGRSVAEGAVVAAARVAVAASAAAFVLVAEVLVALSVLRSVLRVLLGPCSMEGSMEEIEGAPPPGVGVPSSWLIMVLGLMALGLRLPTPVGTWNIYVYVWAPGVYIYIYTYTWTPRIYIYMCGHLEYIYIYIHIHVHLEYIYIYVGTRSIYICIYIYMGTWRRQEGRKQSQRVSEWHAVRVRRAYSAHALHACNAHAVHMQCTCGAHAVHTHLHGIYIYHAPPCYSRLA